MRLVILTSNRRNTASYCLPLLLERTNATVVKVIFCENQVVRDMKFYKRKLQKVMKIGVLGALNGIRLRNWYTGGGLKSTLRDIGDICQDAGLKFVTVPSLRDLEAVKEMEEAKADLCLSLGNSYIPRKIFSIPRYGTINIHGEVLPDFKNAQSVIWQIYQGSTSTGYTIHQVDSGIDTGSILKQEAFPILFRDTLEVTVRDTSDEILSRAALGLVDVINRWEDHLAKARPQGKGGHYTTPTYREYRRMLVRFEQLKKQQH